MYLWLAVDLDEHLIEMPARVRRCIKPSQPSGIGEAKLCRPAPNSLIRNIDAALSQQMLNISKAEWKSKIQPDGMLDDFDWRTVTAIAEIVHRPRLPQDLNAMNYCHSSIATLAHLLLLQQMPRCAS